ncbi:hypothetical protein BTS2_0431 [Bacillus sp. TS-2]|nr:hypothetical protein BTS2_0431 [Bacillus sp. TS-2]
MKIKYTCLLFIFMILSGCNESERQVHHDTQTYLEKGEYFTIELTVPIQVNVDEPFWIEKKLIYEGTDDISVMHTDPFIRNTFLHDNGEEVDFGIAYVDIAISTEFKKGKSINTKEEFILKEQGNYEIITSSLLTIEDEDENEMDIEVKIEPIKMHVMD